MVVQRGIEYKKPRKRKGWGQSSRKGENKGLREGQRE